MSTAGFTQRSSHLFRLFGAGGFLRFGLATIVECVRYATGRNTNDWDQKPRFSRPEKRIPNSTDEPVASPKANYLVCAFVFLLTFAGQSTGALLPAPTLSAPASGATGVSTTPTFSWSQVTGANRYWLMIATNSSALPTDPAAASCAGCVMAGYTSATSHTLPNAFPNGGTPAAGTLSAGTTYYWKVQGFNNTVTPNTQGNYSATGSFTTAASLLGAPTLSAPASGATGVSTTPTFSWSQVTGANRYWLMIATSAGAFPTDPAAASCTGCVMAGYTNATSHTLPNAFPNGGTPAAGTLSAGTTYYWKVQGFNNTTSPNTQGNYSATGSFITVAPAFAQQFVVNGHVLSSNQTKWVTYVGTSILPQLLETISDKATVASRVSWWSLKEGIFGLDNPHVFSLCHTSSGDVRHDSQPLITCDAGQAWQVGLAAVQVPDHTDQSVLDALNALWQGRAVTDVLGEAARLAGFDPTTGTGAAIVASTGYLRRSWLLRHPVIGMYLEEPVVTAECINSARSWCYGTGWQDSADYAPTQQAAFQTISDLAGIFTSFSTTATTNATTTTTTAPTTTTTTVATTTTTTLGQIITVTTIAPTTTTTTTTSTTSTTVGSTTTTTTPAGTVILFLNGGWNLVGNSSSGSLDVATAFGNTSNVITVWKWVANGAKWAFYAPSLVGGQLTDYANTKGYDVLTTINGGEGFWVNAKTPFTAQLPAGAAITSTSFLSMASGWNLNAVGDNLTPSAFNKTLSATPPAPGEIPLNLTTLWAWDAALTNWYFYAPSLERNGLLLDYIQTKGYLDFGTKVLTPTTGFWVNKP